MEKGYGSLGEIQIHQMRNQVTGIAASEVIRMRAYGADLSIRSSEHALAGHRGQTRSIPDAEISAHLRRKAAEESGENQSGKFEHIVDGLLEKILYGRLVQRDREGAIADHLHERGRLNQECGGQCRKGADAIENFVNGDKAGDFAQVVAALRLCLCNGDEWPVLC